ncbi:MULTISPECIES: sodium/proline symporter PutP [unclassified Exiguobacterium]|uniref:sodium/proline symporter PutP n=1 Tax=unclassified Exiguobacterium TaxID=2644629 RepID=UPI00103F572A|nr:MULTISPECIES: sodium/proline symporter PutP [unclassified Exiguobacterium]TCI24717.1 sodium/proline symporter PutP [Exiguobacterium sp. SH5S4]TCI57164.1 sodium/proline symporter PutP [Exiguobacterium sp. SH5S13]TCI62661.1 sodium/proline symporter PutP [Exiguobacterium sp. SH3S1]
MNGILVSITIYMVLMVVLGVVAYRRTESIGDYMLGGRGLGPGVAALSAGASDMSGWLLMGLPGAMFATGLSSGWIVIGLTIGAYLNWLLVAPRLRTYSYLSEDAITIPDFFEKRFKDSRGTLRTFSAAVTLIFFTLYATSGFVAGGRLFNAVFGIEFVTGVLILASIIILYTFIGGFLAVSWTDFVQGLIMLFALIFVPAIAITATDGVSNALQTIGDIDSALLDPWTGQSFIGIVSLFAWGLGYFGQPHIIVRFMAIKKLQDIKTARRIGISWMLFTVVGAMATGLIGLAYYTQQGLEIDNPENIFINLSDLLFIDLITGVLLAALLAAIMSTISSQLLVSSSAATTDFYQKFFRKQAGDRELVMVGRITVILVSVVSIWLAFGADDTILNLVGYAWAGFGSSFGPLILFSLFWKRTTRQGALAGMLTGAFIVIVWKNFASDWFGTVGELYEMVPAFFLSALAIYVVSLMTPPPSTTITNEFEQMEHILKKEGI